ncbi:hypothetical protein [Thalassotalea fusca]
MKIKWILPLTLMAASFATAAEKWEARVDKNVNSTKANQIAQQYRPKIHCNGTDRPDTQVCYSNAIKLLVVDGDTRTMYAFEIDHDNQSQPSYLMNLYVNSISIPANVVNVMHETLDTYNILGRTIDEVDQHLNSQNIKNLSQLARLTSSNASANNCEESAESKVVKAAYSANVTSKIQSIAKNIFSNKYASLDNSIFGVDLSNFSFNVSGQGVTLSGTSAFNAIPKIIEKSFWHGADNSIHPSNENTAAYDLTLNSGSVALSVNEVRTRLDGMSLNRLTNSGATKASVCLLEELNKYLPATVEVYGNSSTSPSEGPTSLPLGYNRVPVTQSNGRTGGQILSDLCVWRFYLNGKEISNMIGPCP